MASVPSSYTGVPDVAPEMIATPGPRQDTPFAAFGGDTARAMSGLGNAVEKAGDTLFARAYSLQQLNNETEAREADAQYMIEAGQLHANYNALQGKDRVTAFPKYQADLQESRLKLRNNLSNPMAQKMYDASSLSTMGRSIFNGAGAAAAANKEWSIGTVKAQLELDTKTVEDNPNDEGLFQDKLRRIEDSARNLAAQTGAGVGSPQEELLIRSATSKVWAARITGLAKIKPFEALELLDKNRTKLLDPDFKTVDNLVRAQGRAVGASNIANGVYDPTKPLAEMEQAVKDKAAKVNPDDPLLADHAVSNLRTKYNQDKYATKQEETQLKQDTTSLIVNNKPKTLQEFMQLPGGEDIYKRMKPSEQAALPGQINRYNSAVGKVENDEEFIRLKGMSLSPDPAAREEFLNTDATKSKLNTFQMSQIMSMQAKMKQQAEGDPRVQSAARIMKDNFGAQLQTLGIYKRDANNPDDYDHYIGAMSAALDAWQATHDKPATSKDITETIGPQLIRQKSEPGMFYGTNLGAPFFKQTVPDEYANEVRRITREPGYPPELIYRQYIKDQLKNLYGPVKKSDKQ